MEKTELVICDTNILIEIIDRNNNEVIEKTVALGEQNLCISSITFSEVIIGARNKIHLHKLLRGLDKFILIPLNSRLDEIHRSLVQKYYLSHQLSIQDSLIAATALHYDLPLYTLNVKDFKFIEGLKLIK